MVNVLLLFLSLTLLLSYFNFILLVVILFFFFDTEIFMLKVNSIKLLYSITSTSKVNLACSRHSDRGDNAKRCEEEKNKQRWGGVGVRAKELSLSLFSSLFFSRSLPSGRTRLSERLEQAKSE